ncbi:hypothetical protein CMI37_12405 [Candidatus Pacearchaeota archaeon]|nr:hypothetical protein [Candidatus Pacearchaeota archaeon]|tara:strand:- start:4166 stop:4849 length:684 start_codon:yes stop_codon:yes gene_type:complete
MEKETNPKIYKAQKLNNINIHPGDLKGSPDESFSLRDTLVFIDEAFLSRLSKHFGQGTYLRFDRFSFSKNLAKRENLNLKGIFMYIAPPFQSEKPSKQEELKKEGYDKFIKKLKQKEIIVREGRCQRILNEKGEFEYRQKGVDILLAIDLMNVLSKYSDVKRTILIASDSDFVPVIKNLEEKKIKTILYTFYQKKRNTEFSRSNHLIKSVHKYVLLTKQDFENSPLK